MGRQNQPVGHRVNDHLYWERSQESMFQFLRWAHRPKMPSRNETRLLTPGGGIWPGVLICKHFVVFLGLQKKVQKVFLTAGALPGTPARNLWQPVPESPIGPKGTDTGGYERSHLCGPMRCIVVCKLHHSQQVHPIVLSNVHKAAQALLQ